MAAIVKSVLLVGVILFPITCTAVNFNATLYHVIIPVNNVEAAGAYVFTVGFSPELLPSEIVSAFLLGEMVPFLIQTDTLVVTTMNPITSAGRYTFDVSVLVLDDLLIVPAVVDVTSQDGEACLDQAFGNCSQLCEESSSEVYKYTCSCISGYSLQIDGLTCVADEPQRMVLFSHDGGVAVFNPNARVTSSVLSLSGVDSFGYNYQDGIIYYADNTRNVIARAAVDGTTGEEVLMNYTDQQVIKDIAVDWLENILLFSDSSIGAISQLDLITLASTPAISGLLNPRAIAVQPQAEIRLIFWIEGDVSSSTIKQAFLNGTGSNSIATDLVNPIDITIDLVAGRLYWISGDGCITSSPFNGMDSQTVFQIPNTVPVGIAVFEDFVYILLRSNKTIARVDKLMREGSFPLYFDVSVYMNLGDISVYHPLMQPPVSHVVGNCAVNNGGCSQLCVVVNQPECQCQYGYKLSNDGTSCFPDQVSELLFSSFRRVDGVDQSRGTVLQSSTDGQLEATLVDTSHGNSMFTGLIYAMQYDPETETVYYGDRNTSTLWKVPLQRLTSSQDDRMLLYNGTTVWGMAYDWINHYLYWTDDSDGSISRVLLSSFESVETVATQLSQPQGISVDPFNEWIYWTEAGRISRSRFDGSAVQILFEENVQPSGIVIDFYKQRLLWGDTGSIQYCSLNGTGRTTLYSEDGLRPFQLGILGDYLAWTSMESHQFSLLKLYDTEPVTLNLLTPSSELLPVVGLAVISDGQLTRGSAMCVTNVLECSHYCNVDLQDRPRCMCPDGYNLLEDEHTCLSNTSVCSTYPCQNGGTCIEAINGYTCACPNGFSDDTCLTNVNDCSPNPCLNGGTCMDGVNAYTCECPVGFTDDNCSTNVDNCISSPCENGGTCFDGEDDFTCECPIGFSDDTCSTNINDCLPNPCLNGGTCMDDVNAYTCECPVGFTDEDCSAKINDCSMGPCQNNGTCVELEEGYLCMCMVGFAGDDCGMNVNDCIPNPCQNGATCYDELNSFRCECATGYTESDCSVEIDECTSNPCQNGNCTNGIGNFTCECFVGYTGRYCDEDINECISNICQNGATCFNNLGGYSCSCTPGYTGSSCQNECLAETFGQDCGENCTCENGGTCDPVDGTCACPLEYTGQNCEEPICSNPCINGGTCVQPDTCTCPETYGGTVCELRVCTSDYCQNGGTCFVDFGINLACRCLSTTIGPQCQFDNGGFNPQTSPELQAGVSVGVVLSVISITAVVVAIIIVYYKCIRRRHRSQQLYYKSNLEYDNPVYTEAGQSLLGKSSNASAMDNPIYGYYTSSTSTEESSIAVENRDKYDDNHTAVEFSAVAIAANPKCSDVTALVSPYNEIQDID